MISKIIKVHIKCKIKQFINTPKEAGFFFFCAYSGTVIKSDRLPWRCRRVGPTKPSPDNDYQTFIIE